MIPVVIGRPYQFVPPYAGTNWLRVIKPIVPWFLRRSWGVETIDFRGGERLAESLRAGHGVLIAANHARPCDPFVIGLLPLRLGKPCHYLAAWHIFTNDSRFHAWLLRRVGAFSIHRWGLDRESLKASIQILADARRPLMLFPEGLITRANDRLGPVLDGTAFIARSAARQRAKQSPAGKIVVHPAAIHYCFDGDICDAVDRVLSPIEKRLGWQVQRARPALDRVHAVGEGLLTLKEIEYLGAAQAGPLSPRVRSLIEAILQPMEREWLRGDGSGPVVERVKRLRTAILPDLLAPSLPPAEREGRWRQVADCYLAQQLDCYPDNYLGPPTTVDRILETIERFEEDLTDSARIHRPLRAIVQFGRAIPIDPASDRRGDDEFTRRLEGDLKSMVADLAGLSRSFAATSARQQGPA